MNEGLAILTVIGLFLFRIGIPLILLIALGTLLEKHQTRQRAEMMKIHKLYTELEEEENESQKAA